MEPPLIGRELLEAEADNLSPDQVRNLHAKAVRYERSLKAANQSNPEISPNGFMLARLFTEFDGLRADMKETVRNMDDSLRNTAQVMLGNLEVCQTMQGKRFAAMHRAVKAIAVCVAVMAAVMAGGLAGGREWAVKVAAMMAKVFL